MKKLFVFVLLCASLFLQAQQTTVSYYDVLNHFFSQHSFEPKEPAEGLNFAKKKEGWYVQIINRMTEEVKNEQLFWSANSGWHQPTGFEKPLSVNEQEEKVYRYLSNFESVYQFYGYERCPYYGYNGWDEDLIRDFGHLPLTALPDSVLESLGRANSAYATRFCWHQFGGTKNNADSLQRRLQPLEKPSAQRTDSMVHYISKAIACYAVLKDRNPFYQTLVGNIGFKHFNEEFYGYDQLMMAGYDEKAKQFLEKIKPNQTVIQIAKNYLDNCPQNSILFSFGDLDTYPLWYVQQAMKYRTDVIVLNQSMLGFPPHIDLLRRKKTVRFAATPELYGSKSFQYSLYQEEKNNSITRQSLSAFLQNLYKRKNKADSYDVNETATYPVKSILLTLDLTKFKKIGSLGALTNTIRFQLKDYLSIDEAMVLDVIQNNIYNRAICFTTQWEACKEYLLQTGTVYRLLPLDAKKTTINEPVSIKQIEMFLTNKFHFVTSVDVSTGITPPETYNATNYNLASQVIDWYWRKGQKAKAVALLNKLDSAYNGQFPSSIDSYHGYLFFLTGNDKKGKEIFERNASFIYSIYKKPSPFYPILTKDMTKLTLSKLQMELEYKKMKSLQIDNLLAAIAE